MSHYEMGGLVEKKIEEISLVISNERSSVATFSNYSEGPHIIAPGIWQKIKQIGEIPTDAESLWSIAPPMPTSA